MLILKGISLSFVFNSLIVLFFSLKFFWTLLQADRQYEIPQPHRLSKQPKDAFLIEQVFSPHPYPASLKSHMKSNPLYTDMRLTELAEVKRAQPSWTIEEYTRNSGDKGKIAALDLQVSPICLIWTAWLQKDVARICI